MKAMGAFKCEESRRIVTFIQHSMSQETNKLAFRLKNKDVSLFLD